MYRKTLLLSSLIGFVIGILWKSDWQWSLEVAQVLARTVVLPTNNPLTIFAHHLYAPFLIWPQVVLLNLGATTFQISLLFSGIQSALSFVSVTALLLIFSNDATISLLTPLVITGLTNNAFSGHNYPVFFPTDLNNGGIIGFYTAMFSIALLGMGSTGVSMFLLGLLPSLHPGIAMGVWLGAGVFYLISDATHKKEYKKHWKWLLCGILIFIITLLVHRAVSGSFFETASPTEKKIVEYYVSYVDGHRKPTLHGYPWIDKYVFIEPEIFMFVCVVLFFGRYKKFISDGTQTILKIVGVMSVVGMCMTILWSLYSMKFPGMFKTIMYARWLNFDSIILPLFTIGTLSLKQQWTKLAVLLGVFIFARYGFDIWRWWLVGLIISMEIQKRKYSIKSIIWPKWKNIYLVYLGIGMSVFMIFRLEKDGLWPLMRHTSRQDNVLTVLSHGKGLFISSFDALPLPQAMTNRGLVFNLYWMDTMTYVPTVADEVEAIMNRVYGLSLFDKGIWPGLIPIQANWEKRSAGEWHDIGTAYGATQVVAPSTWSLQLPKVIDSGTLTIYQIL